MARFRGLGGVPGVGDVVVHVHGVVIRFASLETVGVPALDGRSYKMRTSMFQLPTGNQTV